ncbi:hypothetical protein BC830DRAFT_617226 [Chytriomyces sp. MP71]|nr:hypothetical protein BC830DRAFT_617226 [Chytriomyces sp. MP71]
MYVCCLLNVNLFSANLTDSFTMWNVTTLDSVMGTQHITPFGQLILGVCYGSVTEICIGSLFTIVAIQMTAHKKRESTGTIAASLMTINNITNAFFSLTSLTIFWNTSTCAPFLLASNISSHIFLSSFSVYVLFCAYQISNRNIRVKQVSMVLLVHRVAWGAADIALSYGQYDSDSQQCIYVQNPVTAFSNVSDMLCDAFATLVTVFVATRRLSAKSNMSRGLLERSIVRSVTVIGSGSFLVLTGQYWTDPFWILFAYAIQAWIIARLLNFDLFFLENLETRLSKSPVLSSALLSPLPGFMSLSRQSGKRSLDRNT